MGCTSIFDRSRRRCAPAKTPGALVPYTLSDMAADGVALLDVVGVERAHVAGVSMGGMIAQTIAIEHPDRTRSLASIMSTTGELAYGRATEEANAAILSTPPAEREAYIAQSLEHWKIWSSRYHGGAEALLERLARQYDRMFYPEGATRQLGAIIASGDRSKGLGAPEIPTVVIHGRQDTLIQPSGGERTAELVPGSRLLDARRHGPRPAGASMAGDHRRHRGQHRTQHSLLDPV